MRTGLRRGVLFWGIAAIASSTSGRLATQPSLFEPIRRADSVAVRTVLWAGADVNATDESGATPLMYAALYADAPTVRLLLDRGARVDAANTFGVTALMWATRRADIVKLLLEHGADVQARARNGWTPLAVAARAGKPDVVRLLLDAGADIKSKENRRAVLTGAYSGVTPDIRQVLADAGLVVSATSDLSGPSLSRARADLATLRRLLDLGFDANEEVPLITLSLPTAFLAAREGQFDALKALVEKGADPTHVGARNTTALMLAAGAERPNLSVLQFLLDKGTDINATDTSGRTALDWALTRGETEVSAFLRRAGGRSGAPVVPAPVPVTSPRHPREAIELAIAQLQPAGRAFTDRTKCVSCHNENIPGIAVALARGKGLRVDEALAGHAQAIGENAWRGRRELTLLNESTATIGIPPNAGYGLLEMAEAGRPASLLSDAVVIAWSARQMPDGRWAAGNDVRPPLNGSDVVQTALAIRALRTFGPAGYRDEFDQRVGRAREFLRRTDPADTQEQAFKLLGLKWSGAPQQEIERAKTALIAFQREDGGWAQMPTLASDAYATGQALYALRAAAMNPSESVFRRGAEYLLRTQLEDGTWFVRTRAFGVQQYFETGFPHGPSQFISATATAWAAIALTYTLE